MAPCGGELETGTPNGFASYLDGRLVERRDSADEPIPNHNAQVYFGCFNGTDEFAQGQVDEIAIWNRALSGADVTTGWNRRLTGTGTGLVGYWSFEDGTGLDTSPNGNRAESGGMPSWWMPRCPASAGAWVKS